MASTPLARWVTISASAEGALSGWAVADGPLEIPVSLESSGLLGVRVSCPEGGAGPFRSGLSRCALYANNLRAGAGGSGAVTPPLILEAWAWSAGTATLIGTVTTLALPMRPEAPGLLLQASGVLAEGYEFRARIAPGGGVFPVRGYFRAVVDRASDPPALIGPAGSAIVPSVNHTPL